VKKLLETVMYGSAVGMVAISIFAFSVAFAQTSPQEPKYRTSFYNRERVNVYEHTAYIPVDVIGMPSMHRMPIDWTVTDFEKDHPDLEVTGVAFETHEASHFAPVHVEDTLDYIILTFRHRTACK
jgi:hypothetical protein